jgi:signal transduction histidine kinase
VEKGVLVSLAAKETIIFADEDRLKQVFVNLLSNAVKYTDKGSIEVSLNCTADGCTVSVADTGIGIPENDLSRVFERFFRSDKSRSRTTGGAGIGLAIAQAIVAAHGGKIEAASKMGQGSVFSVFLPKTSAEK